MNRSTGLFPSERLSAYAEVGARICEQMRAKVRIHVLRRTLVKVAMPEPEGRSAKESHCLSGPTVHPSLTDCPLAAIEFGCCSGRGDWTSLCSVSAFKIGRSGGCIVADDELSFGRMASVAQCLVNGVVVRPRESERVTAEELLR